VVISTANRLSKPIPSGTRAGIPCAAEFQPFSDELDAPPAATLIYTFIGTSCADAAPGGPPTRTGPPS
jgi:hypothetical protein